MRRARQLSVLALLLAAAVALYSGIKLIMDPSGASIHFPFQLLQGTIFSDYLLPGWILTMMVGFSSLLIVLAILSKTNWYSVLIMLQGFIICVFDLSTMLLLSHTFLVEYLYLLLGIMLIALGTRQYERKIVAEVSNRTEGGKK